MTYAVKEIFYTLQGNGAHSGRPAVFLRFAGCNLWSGREEDRSAARCWFCDTDFVGFDGQTGGQYGSAKDLADAVAARWPADRSPITRPYVVCTGGEPLLQLDAALVDELHGAGFEVAVETNGTLASPPGIDWTCVSPKEKTSLTLKSGDELKLVYPQRTLCPEAFLHLNFRHFFLQPMDCPCPEDTNRNIRLATEYCLAHPPWRLSLQIQKVIGLP